MVCCICPCDFWITDILALKMIQIAVSIISPTFEQLCTSGGGAIEGICPTGIVGEITSGLCPSPFI